MKNRSTTLLVLVALALVPNRFASAHGIEAIVGADANNKLQVDFSGNPLYAYGAPVYADSEFRFDTASRTSNIPSFDVSGFPSSSLGLKIMSPLLVWTPASGVNTTTSASIALQSQYYLGEQATVTQTTISATSAFSANNPNTFELSMSNDPNIVGVHHLLQYQYSVGAPDGAYGVLVELRQLGATPSLTHSDPFLLVLNKGLSNGFTQGTTPSPYSDDAQVPLDGSQFGTAVDALLRQVFPVGDMNGDGVVNNFDIGPFELALANPTAYHVAYPSVSNYQVRGDVNGDGAFNNFDISPFELRLAGHAPVIAAVPEPATLLLAIVGLLAVAPPLLRARLRLRNR